MASLDQLAIEQAYLRGWFFGATGHKYGIQQKDLRNLTPADEPVIDAFKQGSRIQSPEYTAAVENIYERAPYFDGILGPAMNQMLRVERCGLPDFSIPKDATFAFDDPAQQEAWECLQLHAEMPATGSGSWSGCHDVGDYHSAIVELDLRNLPSRMRETLPNGKTVLWEVLNRVQKSKAAYGLLYRFRLDAKDYLTGESLEGRTQTALSLVGSSNGWIGLAIVPGTLGCQAQPIWLRLLSTYNPFRDLIWRYIDQWWKLISHELGHNESSGHIAGDLIMNPSIQTVESDFTFPRDSAYGRYLTQKFGGSSDPDWFKDTPDPPEPPKPPTGDPFAGTKVHFETENGTFWGPYELVHRPRIPV